MKVIEFERSDHSCIHLYISADSKLLTHGKYSVDVKNENKQCI